jgi:hypothetical protein
MGNAAELIGVTDGSVSPAKKSDGRRQDAKLRIKTATLNLASSTVDKVAGTVNNLFKLPRGCGYEGIMVQSSVSLTTSQLKFGIVGDDAIFGALKAYGTTAEAEVKWGSVAQKGATPSDDDRMVIMTSGTADLPGAGIVRVTLFYSGR